MFNFAIIQGNAISYSKLVLQVGSKLYVAYKGLRNNLDILK